MDGMVIVNKDATVSFQQPIFTEVRVGALPAVKGIWMHTKNTQYDFSHTSFYSSY